MLDGNGQKGSKWPVDLRIWMEVICACDILHGTMESNILWKRRKNIMRSVNLRLTKQNKNEKKIK